MKALRILGRNIRDGFKNVVRNILLTPWKDFCGFFTFHMPTSFLKTTFLEIDACEKKLLDTVSRNKFRKDDDVNQWLFQYWQLASGNYVIPKNARTKLFDLNEEELKQICEAISHRKYKMICINDVVDEKMNYELISKALQESFEKVLPKKSEFEI